MKFSKLKAVALVLVVFLLSGLSYGQECANGQCYRQSGVARQVVGNTVRGTAQAVDRAGTIAVHATGAVIERVVDATGQILTATVDTTGNVVYAAARVATAPVRVVSAGLAQSKAERQASSNRLYHVGGGFGGGCAEGVGFSTSSPDRAIRACCYWGKLPVQEIGVARGRNGWYATVIYSQRATGPSRQQVTQYMQSNNGSAPPASWYPNGDPWRNLTAKEVNEAFGD